MERIKYSCYKYAPESARVTVNGKLIDVSETLIPQLIACGKRDDAIAEIKKVYRQSNKKDTRYVYAFFENNSNRFYYVSALNFLSSDGIDTRLHCFKELKHYLMKNPPIIQVESGFVSPKGVTQPEKETIKVELDFTRIAKFKIIFS